MRQSHVNEMLQNYMQGTWTVNARIGEGLVDLLGRREPYEICRESISSQHPSAGLQYGFCCPRREPSSVLDHHDLRDRACVYLKTLQRELLQ